ncbi:dTMP kinase [Marinivivus vitaminiproducens]|uniref:dTMP kinase n=1 Tax=Marinivivus vitaminiproducens TaxID=3035935 RepID=UPI0027A82689|nr:dTMP kinase [Geminicoccaceae bacterium SCSIO 64248]
MGAGLLSPTARRAPFITFEGGEGGGKTTQIARLAETLRARNIAVETTREPGGTDGAELIRDLLVHGPTDRWLPLTETMLHVAARHEHVARRIRPALEQGRWVLCDRFLDSTRIYQGVAAGVAMETIDALHRLALDGLVPDLTLILDLASEAGLSRRARAGGAERYERMGAAFHQRVRDGFRALAESQPERCVLIDANRSKEQVAADIWLTVRTRLLRDRT